MTPKGADFGRATIVARELGASVQLLADGATVPFIVRCRKEVTGSLDEVAVRGRARHRRPGPGMVLPGIVTNVTAFGAFVDIGVHQDGLVHVGQLADRYVKDPNEVVRVRQHVQVRVLRVDAGRKRISLSIKKP